MHDRTLTGHHDIRRWAEARRAQPALALGHGRNGELRRRLALRFSVAAPSPVDPSPESEGLAPCSWTAWLAELDRQNLALKVRDIDTDVLEFVARGQNRK
jgi:hypothetical protein